MFQRQERLHGEKLSQLVVDGAVGINTAILRLVFLTDAPIGVPHALVIRKILLLLHQ
jgi:hypothetical protein